MAKPKVELSLRLQFPQEEKVDLKVAHIKKLEQDTKLYWNLNVVLQKKLQIVLTDNDDLRNLILAYDSGMKDPKYVMKPIPEHRDHNPTKADVEYKDDKGNTMYRQRKGWEFTKPIVLTEEVEVPEVPIEDILEFCTTDHQKRVAMFYYDKQIDSYNSYQKVAEVLGLSRQSVYSAIKTIQKNFKKAYPQ